MSFYHSLYHKRKSIRLKGYDYSQPGEFFITICTKDRECIFGKIKNGKMILNEMGEIAEKIWKQIPEHFPNTELDEFIVMPNHLHGEKQKAAIGIFVCFKEQLTKPMEKEAKQAGNTI